MTIPAPVPSSVETEGVAAVKLCAIKHELNGHGMLAVVLKAILVGWSASRSAVSGRSLDIAGVVGRAVAGAPLIPTAGTLAGAAAVAMVRQVLSS